MNCRSCGAQTTPPIISLGKIPLPNELISNPGDKFQSFPLNVVICPKCSLGQLEETVPPEVMFSEYLFYSSVQGPVVERARKLVERIGLKEGLVIEIASNDGYLLDFYKQKGINVLGIDPARGPANQAALKGIPTIQAFFNFSMAKTLPKADIVHANNVLAHVPSLNDFVAGIAQILKPEGKAFIEVPYLGDLLRGCYFDTIYHEHVFYFSIKSLTELFKRHGLNIMDVEPMPDVLGGSIRITAGRGAPHCSMEEYGLNEVNDLQKRAEYRAKDLKATLQRLKKEGKRVWGFGAAAKTTVFMNYAGIDSTLIDFIADDTPDKQGKYIPGTGVQVRSTQEWLKAQPDYTCIFTWNYAHFIANKFSCSYDHRKLITSHMPYVVPSSHGKLDTSTELCKIATKWKTDKVPSIGHSYTPYYYELLKGRNVKRILEIGIGGGEGSMYHIPGYIPGASLFMWQEFFPDAEIYALDINPKILINKGNIKSYVCDQGNEASLRDVMHTIGGKFDLIIDDGSHNPEHQILSANVLVPFLNQGGLYIIEDVSDPKIVSEIDFKCEIKEFNTALKDDRLIVIKPGPKILIAFLGWVGGAKKGDHQALRDTWLKDLIPNMDYKFFIGDGTPLPKEEDKMINEGFDHWAEEWEPTHAKNKRSAAYDPNGYQSKEDEVIIHFPDGYQYLPYKRKESLRWALEHDYDYIFCASVDVYARPERLVKSEFEKYDYHGMYCGNKGFTGTSNYIPESYIFGGGYWLSAKAAKIIVDTPVTYWCEDWWVGLALIDAIRNKKIIRNDSVLGKSKYGLPPYYPNVSNDLISVELSGGCGSVYDNKKMYECHKNFYIPKLIQPVVPQVIKRHQRIVQAHKMVPAHKTRTTPRVVDVRKPR